MRDKERGEVTGAKGGMMEPISELETKVKN